MANVKPIHQTSTGDYSQVSATEGLDVAIIDRAGAITIGKDDATSVDVGSTAGGGVATTVVVPDATATAFKVQDPTETYLSVTTSTGTEAVAIGNATNNPAVSLLGTGQKTLAGNVDSTGGLDVTGGNFTAAGGTVDLDPTENFTLDMDATKTVSFTLADDLANAIRIVDPGVGMTYLSATTVNAGSAQTISIGSENVTCNVPAGVRFAVGGTALTTANFTAANVSTLLTGVASNADSLHTHAGIGTAAQTIVPGFDTTTPASGQCCYVTSTANVLDVTAAETAAYAHCAGVFTGTAGSIVVAGKVTAMFTTDAGQPANGAKVYLAMLGDDSNAGAGKMRKTVTAIVGEQVAPVGICLDNALYAASKTCVVLLQLGQPIVEVEA